MYLKSHSLDSTDFLDEVNDSEYSRVAGPEFWKKKKIDPFAGVEMAHSGPKKSTFCKNALERFVR